MSKDKDNNSMLNNDIKAICSNAISIIKYARSVAVKNINIIQLITYYIIGMWIVEEEQKGDNRAEYGKKVLETLSERLNAEFGKGFSIGNLRNFRQFYMVYKDRIRKPVVSEFISGNYKPMVSESFELKNESTDSNLYNVNFYLDWSHYLILMRIENDEERSFYEIESNKSNWSKRELQRQYNSSLYERLALSKNKNAVMKMANEGNIIEKPSDIIKQPTVL